MSQKLVVEIDGGYHDAVDASDISREAYLRKAGWDVLRLTDKDVEMDAEAVGHAIAKHLRIEHEFQKRNGAGSGMKHGGTRE